MVMAGINILILKLTRLFLQYLYGVQYIKTWLIYKLTDGNIELLPNLDIIAHISGCLFKSVSQG